MKLRNQSKGAKVAIRENVFVYPHCIRNTYTLLINVGKGKTRAMMLKHAIEKLLRSTSEVPKETRANKSLTRGS